MKLGMTLSGTLRTAHRNIYQRRTVAKHYDKTFVRSVASESFDAWVSSILQLLLTKDSTTLNILEGGMGTGLFTLPVIRHLLDSNMRGVFSGIDNSKAMLDVLFNKSPISNFQSQAGKRIGLGFGDLDYKLPWPNSHFQLVILAGVMHCLRDVKATIAEIRRVLARNGYLIVIAKTDNSTRIQSGEEPVGCGVDSKYVDFWKYYYDLRKQMEIAVDPRCPLVFDTTMIKREVTNAASDDFEQCESRVFQWGSKTQFSAMVDGIKKGLSFALGQGISHNDREQLAEKMTRWIESQSNPLGGIELDHTFEAMIWNKTA